MNRKDREVQLRQAEAIERIAAVLEQIAATEARRAGLGLAEDRPPRAVPREKSEWRTIEP